MMIRPILLQCLILVAGSNVFVMGFLHQTFRGNTWPAMKPTSSTAATSRTTTITAFGRMNSGMRHSLNRGFCWHLKSAELHTAYEYLARQRGSLVSQCINWMDPSFNIVPSPKPVQMGFQIDQDSLPDNEPSNDCSWRLPIYPVSAVHLPSSSLHTLHNTMSKNLKMSRDLRANQWNIQFHRQIDNDNTSASNATTRDPSQCFVLTLMAQDTHRIASSGTLMEVVSMEDTFTSDKTLIRVIVKCRAIGIVKIVGVEKETIETPNDYLIGKVRPLQLGFDPMQSQGVDGINEPQNYSSNSDINREVLNQIQQDYAAVRSMYTTNSVASRELPPYARDAVQANMPVFSEQDFACPAQFWNVAECWQTLCNTVRDARRSDLQSDINEIMIDAACKKKGPLKLPVKRKELPDEVQSLIIRMEKERSEDFLSCGLDACLDFQVLLGMGRGRDDNQINNKTDEDQHFDASRSDLKSIHGDRISFLGKMIWKEKNRLEAKERLKDVFSGSVSLDINASDEDNTTCKKSDHHVDSGSDSNSFE